MAVDTLTGRVQVDRVDILHDVGKSLNPAIDMGQVEGGFVQGMGWLTTEELWWDEDGHLRTHAPSTYKIPACSDLPRTSAAEMLESAAEPRGDHLPLQGGRRAAPHAGNLGTACPLGRHRVSVADHKALPAARHRRRPPSGCSAPVEAVRARAAELGTP